MQCIITEKQSTQINTPFLLQVLQLFSNGPLFCDTSCHYLKACYAI